MVHHSNHLSSQTGPVSVLGLRVDTLQLVLVENGSILQHALEHCLSASYSWIPTVRGEGGYHLRSSLIAHLWGVGMKGLGMVRCTCQNVPLVARDFNVAVTSSTDGNSCTWNGSINSGIWVTCSENFPLVTWPFPLFHSWPMQTKSKDSKQVCGHLLPWEVSLVTTGASLGPALAMHQLS